MAIALKTRSQTRQVAALNLRAELGAVDKAKRTVEVVFATPTRVLRNSWFDGPSYEELSLDPAHVRMGRLQGGAPFLADHDGRDVAATLGVVQSASVDGKRGIATIRFVAEGIDPVADQIYRKIEDKIITHVSVGYRTYKAEKIESGADKVPVFRAVDWEPHEISAVALPADPDAEIRSRGAPSLNPCEFLTRSMENAMTEEEKKALELAEQKRQADALAAREEIRAAAQKAERERISGINHAVRSLGEAGASIAAAAIKDGTDLNKVRELVLAELATRDAGFDPVGGASSGVQRGEEDADKWRRGAIAGVLARTGQLAVISTMLAAQSTKQGRARNPDIDAAFKGFDANDTGGEFRGMSLVDFARESLERRGEKTRGMSAEKIVERALFARDNGGQNSSSDFSVVLENVMYKTLLGEYARQDDTWRRFAGVDSVQDFRASNRFRLGSFGVLDQIGESGEYKQKQIPDGIKQSITTDTYGNKIALSRKAIINDDMGAVMASAGRFGRMAGLSIESAVYALLAQNAGLGPTVTYNGITATLFHASFANVGAGAALSMTALEANRVVMASQQDISNNEYLNIRPNTLLVPLGLEGEANVINRAKFDPTASTAFERPNIVGGLFRDVVGSPRITGTRRYLFSDQTPALLVAFLNGVQAPMMEQRAGWDIDGIEWKVRLDFKAQGFDPKGALTDAGV